MFQKVYSFNSSKHSIAHLVHKMTFKLLADKIWLLFCHPPPSTPLSKFCSHKDALLLNSPLQDSLTFSEFSASPESSPLLFLTQGRAFLLLELGLDLLAESSNLASEWLQHPTRTFTFLIAMSIKSHGHSSVQICLIRHGPSGGLQKSTFVSATSDTIFYIEIIG